VGVGEPLPPWFLPSALLSILCVQYRNPDANHRPAFQDIMTPLQKPDFQILQWKNKDASTEAKILGSPLQDGFCLYEDLQKTYLGITDFQHMIEVSVVGEEVCSRFEEISESTLVSTQPNPAYSVATDGDHLSGSVGKSIKTEPCSAYTPAALEVKQSCKNMNGETLFGIQRTPAYSSTSTDHLITCSSGGSGIIETKPCPAYYVPANLETSQDDTYI
jgi:hypothetical protein